MDKIMNVWHTVLTQRDWSWAAIGIIVTLLSYQVVRFVVEGIVSS